MVRSLLLITALTLVMTACNKADETTSPEDMLRGGQWKRTSLKATYRDGSGNLATTDSYSSLPACVKDNGLEFNVNYAGTEHRNNKCSAGDAAESAFQWEIFNSGKSIRIYNAAETFGVDVNAEILVLSSTQLSMRYQYITQVAAPVQKTDTFTIVDVFRK